MPVAPSESQPWKRWSLHHCILRRVLRKVNTARAEWHKSTISTADYMRKCSLNWLLWAIGSDQFESMSTNLTMQQQAQAAGCSWLCHTLLTAWQWVQVSAQYILSPPPLGLRGNVPYPAVPPCAWDTTGFFLKLRKDGEAPDIRYRTLVFLSSGDEEKGLKWSLKKLRSEACHQTYLLTNWKTTTWDTKQFLRNWHYLK